jgi:protoheme IX farnesyltransferase
MSSQATHTAVPTADASTGPALDVIAPTRGAELPAADEGAVADPLNRGIINLFVELTKARLNGLVLITTAVGIALAETGPINWGRFWWTLLGTGLAAASAAMLNQLLERDRDAQMRRTAQRPLPTGRIPPAAVFVLGVLAAFAGFAVLAMFVNVISATLALANIAIYVIIYTPLKPLTTLNTLVGAICGGIPPMIGWVAVTGSVDPGAWLLGTFLFVWQMPHFLALAWMYREDYRRGGMTMLPVVDPQGELTARVMVLTSLLLAPLGLAATLGGLAGWFSAVVNLAAALAMTWMSFRFYTDRTDGVARRAFLASIFALPVALAAMVVDRGPVSPEAWLRAKPEPITLTAPLPDGSSR